MPRLAPIVRPRGLLLRIVYFFARRRLGRVPGPLTVLAHHRTMMTAASAYELLLERARLVDTRLKTLAGIKVATLIGCVF